MKIIAEGFVNIYELIHQRILVYYNCNQSYRGIYFDFDALFCIIYCDAEARILNTMRNNNDELKGIDESTLSGVMNELNRRGFKEDFKAHKDRVEAIYSKKEYQANELKIVATYRFEGETNPADQSTLFAIEAKDGLKGTLVMSYAYQSNQDEEMLKKIKKK